VTPGVRKLGLVLHVGASVGWLGAAVASLALAVAGFGDAAAYGLLVSVGWTTLVPFSLASLATGLIQGLGTPWGLVRHYWVLIKLVMNVVASGVLLLYMRTLEGGERSIASVVHAAAAIGLLAVALGLSVYKPRGVTPWRRR
jgi:hypothetical protein